MTAPQTMFDGIEPTSSLWVSPSGLDTNDGSQAAPFKTMAKAASVAIAGTAINVMAGRYVESVKLPAIAKGTATAPIWLRSIDGPQRAKIVSANPVTSTIGGFGTDFYIIEGFEIEGGANGIQFNKTGTDYPRGIVIRGNYVHGCTEDGIKASHIDDVWIYGNTVENCGQEGIDVLGAVNVVAAYNEVRLCRSTAAGMFCKGGSVNVMMDYNYVHDVPADGISVGGQTGETSFRPENKAFEAKDCGANFNLVERVGENTIVAKGLLGGMINDNKCVAKVGYSSNIAVFEGDSSPEVGEPMRYSKDVEVARNLLLGTVNKLVAVGANSSAIIHDNVTSGTWDVPVGPAAIGMAPWDELADLKVQIANLSAEIDIANARADTAEAIAGEAKALIRGYQAAHNALMSVSG